MPSASLPDPSAGSRSSTTAEEGEVVDVFVGDSLEEAMAAAVEALGPGLEVRRARKVRAGVRGLLGRDRYEVLAVPGASSAPAYDESSEDPVGSALDALLDAADARESGTPLPPRPPSRPAPPRPAAARATPPRPVPPLPQDDRPGTDAPPVRRLSRPLGRPLPPRDDDRARSVAPDEQPALPAPLPPAPRSGGSPLRRSLRRAPAPDPEPDQQPDVLPAVAAPQPPTDRRPDRGAPLSGRSPHPDPAVADHPHADPPLDDVEPDPQPVRSRPSAPPRSAEPAAPAEPELPSRPRAARRAPSSEDPAPARRRPAAPARAAGPARPTGRALPARSAPAGSTWSRAALAGVGVPEGVLEHLPSTPPRDDLAWVVALTAAIEAAVPPPSEPDEAHPVVVSGHGLEGAVAVLDAGCRGLVPGTITHAGRTAPATATELALVLRHHVSGGA